MDDATPSTFNNVYKRLLALLLIDLQLVFLFIRRMNSWQYYENISASQQL